MKISQREARRLKKRVAELEQRNRSNANAWARDYIGGVHIGTEPNMTAASIYAIQTARRLGHAVVALNHGTETLFYAVKP